MLFRHHTDHNDLAETGRAYVEAGIELIHEAAERAADLRDHHDKLVNHHAMAAASAHNDHMTHLALAQAVESALPVDDPEPAAA